MTVKIRYLIWPLVIGSLAFISVPIFHLLKTATNETEYNSQIPKGYTNDASGLSLTKIDSIVNVSNSKEEIIKQLRALLAYSRINKKPISIAGAKHSMGGHTMYAEGIVLNMRPYNAMQIDTISNILTIGSGALWEEAIYYLDNFDKSVAIMQAFSSFSIGGSISVNGNGWQKNLPPLSSSVISFTLMNYKGEILNCSRTENQELFSLVLGGYGLFGIVLDIKLKILDNKSLTFKRYKLNANEYLSYFKTYASEDKTVELVFGRLNISKKNFLKYATLNVFKLTNKPLVKIEKKQRGSSDEVKRLVFRGSANSEYGKRLRWDLETKMGEFSGEDFFSRNELLNDDVSLIENKDTTSTDILQEYFIPERNFYRYIDTLKKILPNKNIDLLNITIRNVHKDEDSYMKYANENVFGFVFLFNQKKNALQELEMKKLTEQLASIVLTMEGTYYLPYRLHIDKKVFRKIYPQGDNFFKLKLKYDPEEVFKNKFYDHYK